MPGLTDTGSSSALGWLTLQQLWHIPDHKLKPLSVITKTGPTGHMSPACLSITQAGNSLPQLKQLSSCSRRHSKHCHTIEASFLELRYAEALPRATQYFVKVRSWPHLLPGRFTPFKERYLQSFAASTERNQWALTATHFALKSFLLAVWNGHHQVTTPQCVPTELEAKFAYSILFYATQSRLHQRLSAVMWTEHRQNFKKRLTSWRMGRKETSTNQPPIN